jgi:hypothetical protein
MKWTKENVIFVSYALYAVVFKNIETQKNLSFQISTFNVTAHKIFNDKWLQVISHLIY